MLPVCPWHPIVQTVIPQRPAWSPLDETLAMRSRFSAIFVREWFINLAQNPPSATQTRRISQKMALLHKTGNLPGWIPTSKIEPSIFVDFLAVALANGPSATLDFANLIADEPKANDKIYLSLLKLWDEGQCSVAALIALGPIGISPLSSYGMIFRVLSQTIPNNDSQYVILDWYAIDDGDEILRHEAHRTIKYGVPPYINYARHFLNPTWVSEDPEPLELELSNTQAALPEPAPIIQPIDLAPEIQRSATARTKIIWTPPTLPEGVEISERALRELRKETAFAEHRVADAIEVLGKYRQLKLNQISLDDYQIACREKRFLDTRCFSDQSGFTAFANHYEVRHSGKKLRLERHLKWGKSNNPISSLRVYYAWNDDTQTVVIGSAPRHLPVWSTT